MNEFLTQYAFLIVPIIKIAILVFLVRGQAMSWTALCGHYEDTPSLLKIAIEGDPVSVGRPTWSPGEPVKIRELQQIAAIVEVNVSVRRPAEVECVLVLCECRIRRSSSEARGWKEVQGSRTFLLHRSQCLCRPAPRMGIEEMR